MVAVDVCGQATPRRHSLSGGEDVRTAERDLQAPPVVERMRARPLPSLPPGGSGRSHSPPRKPPRNLTASRKKPQTPVEDEAPIFEYVVLSQHVGDEQTPVSSFELQAELFHCGMRISLLCYFIIFFVLFCVVECGSVANDVTAISTMSGWVRTD